MQNAATTNIGEELARTLRVLAEEAALIGGALSRRWFGTTDYQIRRKEDGSEVTDADEAVQRAIIAHLRAARPDDVFLGEEDLEAELGRAGRPTNERVCWVIDPIDGTRNYIRGIPEYTSSVGAMFGGMVVAGAIHVPERDDLYSATRSEGLLVRGPAARLSAEEEPQPGRAPKPLVAIPSSLHPPMDDIVAGWRGRAVLRNLGSSALHLALVAAGRLQATLLSDAKLWDIAAGALMVEVVGGMLTHTDRRPIFPLDVGTYHGEPMASLYTRDAQTHAALLPGP